METRKERAVAFLKLIASGKIHEGFEMYASSDFRHHNAYFPGDAASLMRGMEDSHTNFPHKTFEVHHALEDGDMVAAHSMVHMSPGDLGVVVVHLLRFDGDRVQEMWDVGQPVPEDMPNENGML